MAHFCELRGYALCLAQKLWINSREERHVITMNKKNLLATSAGGIAFIPVVAESLGGLHPTAVDQLRRLARGVAIKTGELEETAFNNILSKGRLQRKQVRNLCVYSRPGDRVWP